MIAPMNIPKHERCTNCGQCCGPIPISEQEYGEILRYLAKHPEAYEVVNGKHEMLECVFRDNANKRCVIYPVRPVVCSIYGVSKSPYLQCPNGNSAQIDFGAIHLDEEIAGIQNLLDWNQPKSHQKST